MTMPALAPALPTGSVLLWRPQGARDFADLAWVIAEALGNGPGVRGLDVSRGKAGLYARVWTTRPEYVAAVAAAFGWELYSPDPAYATTWGEVAGVNLSVSWLAPGPDPVEAPG